jgi:uncharacterized repeat protein (TIGR03803 family)
MSAIKLLVYKVFSAKVVRLTGWVENHLLFVTPGSLLPFLLVGIGLLSVSQTLAQDVLLGVTSTGGAQGSGIAFSIKSTGADFKVHKTFEASSSTPYGSLLQASDGNFYGVTYQGGTYGVGSVYKLCDSSFTVLHSFNYPVTGSTPEGSLVEGSDGNFYGVTRYGGAGGGTVFKITPTGTLTVLHNFDLITTGRTPRGGLVQGNDGNFYGMTYSSQDNLGSNIFKITPTGTITVLHQFVESVTGDRPLGRLIEGSDGNFYGMTSRGGQSGNGTIFKITPAGTVTVLRHLDYTTTGAYPLGTLVQGKDGNFYGLTWSGGTYGEGTVFKITPSGDFTVIRHLDPSTDGSAPRGNLVQGSDGNFYGCTSGGGTYGYGAIFKITPTGTLTVLRYMNATDGRCESLVIQKANPVARIQSLRITENTPKTITLTGTGGSPLSYSIVNAPQYGKLSGSGATRTYTPNANFTGTDSFSFTVTWGCQTSLPAKVTLNVGPDSISTIFRINAGGEAYTDRKGKAFIADQYANSGTPSLKVTSDIAHTEDDVLYRQGRIGERFTYSLPTGNGVYYVVLHFAETYWGNLVEGGVGSRSFNVDMEEFRKLTDYDIISKAGGSLRAVQEAFRVEVKDSVLNIRFSKGSADLALISAIEVFAEEDIRINVAGSAYHSSGQGWFLSDAYYSGGSVSAYAAGAVAGTEDDELYRSNRHSSLLHYNLPTGPGQFQVTLHFNETYWGNLVPGGKGSRRFNVNAEGERKLSGYDTYQRAGGAMHAKQEQFTVTVSDQVLSLAFLGGSGDNSVDFAHVSAIEVIRQGDANARLASEGKGQQTPAVTLYPNPVFTNLTIIGLAQAREIKATSIRDATGRVYLFNRHKLVHEQQLQVDVSSLKPGLYLLQLQSEQGIQVLKFVKQ